MEGPVGVMARAVGVVETIEEVALSEVEIVVAGVAVLILLLGIGVFAHRRLTRTQADRLLDILEDPADVAILMHPNPDPDAMGAAIGIEELADSVGTPATIYYPGQIRHQENRAFRNVLDLDLEHLEQRQQLTQELLVLVDHNEPRGFQGAGGLAPDVVIDHHPGDGTGSAYTDVRSDYGACASIIAEYFEQLGATFPEKNTESSRTDGGVRQSTGDPEVTEELATGLMYGIQADTEHLTRGCTGAEFDASGYLFPAVDEQLLDRIANPQVTSEMLETKARAIQERVINGSFAIADVGAVDDADAIPQAAEELIRLEGISAVVVYGSKDDVLHLSGRSQDDRVHMGRSLQAVFEDVPMASAGGHARMGGGQVPLQYLAGIGPSSVDPDRARSDLRGRLFNSLKGNE